VTMILEWSMLHNIIVVRSFRGITNFQRDLIRGFKKMCASMIEITMILVEHSIVNKFLK
jgi:hypothetical protein